METRTDFVDLAAHLRAWIAVECSADNRHVVADLGLGPEIDGAANHHHVATDLAEHVGRSADDDDVFHDLIGLDRDASAEPQARVGLSRPVSRRRW